MKRLCPSFWIKRQNLLLLFQTYLKWHLGPGVLYVCRPPATVHRSHVRSSIERPNKVTRRRSNGGVTKVRRHSLLVGGTQCLCSGPLRKHTRIDEVRGGMMDIEFVLSLLGYFNRSTLLCPSFYSSSVRERGGRRVRPTCVGPKSSKIGWSVLREPENDQITCLVWEPLFFPVWTGDF